MAAKPRSKAHAGLSLEDRLLMNAVDTVVNNVKAYDPAVLVHLMQEVVKREDLQVSLYRILANEFSPDKLRAMGVEPKMGGHGMAGTTDEALNFLTLPHMHRLQLRGIQQLQEKLMPGGFLMVSNEVSHADATRMLSQCTTQLEKVLRMTKAVRANAEVARLKEAIAKGLEAVSAELGREAAGRALELMQGAMRKHLTATKNKLEQALEEAETLGG